LIWTKFERQFRVTQFEIHIKTILEEVEIAHKLEQQGHWRAQGLSQHKVEAKFEKLQQLQMYEAETEYLQLLYVCDYEFYKNMNSERAPGTCQWLLTHLLFLEWIEWWQGNLCLLLITLGPAMGKSVLARALVDRLTANALTRIFRIPDKIYDEIVCYFFFNNEDESRRDAKSALAAILHQLCKKNKGLFKQAFEMTKNLADKCHSYKSLWDVFKELVLFSDGVQIICVLDALDECEECSRLRFSDNLANLLRRPTVGNRLKVVITSRPYSIISDEFDSGSLAPGQSQRVGHISEETQQIEIEISKFISSKIQQFQRTRQRRIGVNDNVHLTLQKWVMGKTNRNYLWVSFIFKELEKNASLPMNDLKDVIETLPSTCSEAYEKILRQSTYPKKARTLLQAVLGATRPLSLSELNFVLSMRDRKDEGEDVNYIQNLGFAKAIQELCGFFITVDDGKVYLMHQTAKEFLLRPSGTPTSLCDPLAWEHSQCIEAAHELLARTCIQYLQFAVFEERPLQVDNEFLFYDRNSDIHLWHQVDYSEVFARIET
jgi:hypothetical protein